MKFVEKKRKEKERKEKEKRLRGQKTGRGREVKEAIVNTAIVIQQQGGRGLSLGGKNCK